MGCKKNEVKPLKSFDQQTKDYTVFLVNSIWIYKLSNQNTTDTNKISKSVLGSVLDNSLNYEPTFREMTLFSTYYNKVFYYNSDTESEVENLNILRMWFDGARTSTKCVFFSNKAVGDTYNYWFYPDNIVTYQEFLPTYTLEGITYNEVMVFESRYTGASVPFDDVRLPVKVWYAKHVGIIRKEMSNGDFWNLISYDVKQ
jgi:hypothetical protein